MSAPLGILYRGPLDSCNYACGYCPFAKRPAKKTKLSADRVALSRFVRWVEEARDLSLEILFTPYGEALIWPWYQEAMVTLSRVPHVKQVSIQTNASGPLAFLDETDRDRASLWISWHPTEIAREAFAEKVNRLHHRGVRLSVGAVAVPAHIADIELLRETLPGAVSLWLNAQKPGLGYTEAEKARWRAIDPAFDLEARRHRSRGRECLTGEDTISVDGDGNVRRCHFVEEVLGNLYEEDVRAMLRSRACPKTYCDCWIGYANIAELGVRGGLLDGGRLVRMRAAG